MSSYNSWETLRGQPSFRIFSPGQVLAAVALGRTPAGLRALASSYRSLGRYARGRAVWLLGLPLAAVEWVAAYACLAQTDGWCPGFKPVPWFWFCAAVFALATPFLGIMAWKSLSPVARQHKSRHGGFAPWVRVLAGSALWGVLWWLTVAGMAVLTFTGQIRAPRFLVEGPRPPPPVRGSQPGQRPAVRRVVCLSPSLTETVFALGAGDRVVGRTRHCRHPEAAQAVPVIGDYQLPNYEAIALARPDAVLALEEHAPAFPRLRDLRLAVEVFDHRSLEGLRSSYNRLGELLGEPEAARALMDRLEAARVRAGEKHGFSPPPLDQAQNPSSAWSPSPAAPRVLLVLGRDYSASRPRLVYAEGPGNLYSELLALAGARNAYEGALPYPMLGEEGLLVLQPEVVIELVGMDGGMPTAEASRRTWRSLPGLEAAVQGRVGILEGDAGFVPGPRTADFLLELADAAHSSGAPEANRAP